MWRSIGDAQAAHRNTRAYGLHTLGVWQRIAAHQIM
jgi:hypothetical protein